MSEKTYVFTPEGGSGIDAATAALMNGGGFGGGNFWSLLLILLIFGRDGLNRGGYNTDYIGSQLNSALQGNANAISNLSTQLNCSIGQVQSAIATIQSSIQSIGARNDLSFAQTINAVNSGDAAIINALQSCCCDIKTAVTTGFGNLRYENAAQACDVKQTINSSTAAVISKLDAMEDSRKDREISTLTAALTAANSRAERQSELAPIYKQLNDIACKQPQTIPVQYQPFTAIPNCVAYQMGLYGGFPYGNPGGPIWS